MEKFEKVIIKNVKSFKQPTIFFALKNLGISQNLIKHLRKQNSIKLNNKFVNIDEKIKENDILEFLNNPNKKTEIQMCEGVLDIVYEDEDFLIVNKPHNLSCMPSRSHYSNNLGGQICFYMKDKDENFVLRILNRLDKETAGIVVVAKNVIAYNSIKN